ncbi:MAG: M48 family metallopeptidase [Treponema sp.]|nr:M48 family metallopeptidase [Treponema sp.]
MRQETCVMEIPGYGTVSVIIKRKKIASCRLKIFPSAQITFSVPHDALPEWITRYLHSKQDWIAKKLQHFAQTKNHDAAAVINNGMSVRMLGQDMVFSIYRSERTQVYTEDRSIRIGLPDIAAVQEIQRLFESWWRKQALSVYGEILDALYPIIEKHHVTKPRLLIRKMKTLWGSSSPHRGTITINEYLLKARKPCIEYVILHEIIHFLYPHHNQQFTDFLTLYMPDWKGRKKILDTEVVQGLVW